MKIKHKFLAIFVILLLLALVSSSYISFAKTENAVVASAIKTMEHDLEQKLDRIRAFHDKASSDLVLSLNYPAFKEYFSLPETRAGNRYDANGVIQLTPRQRELKERLDKWTLFLQKRYPIAETCIIDQAGQEHSRLTHREVAPDEDFSSEEAAAGFFQPTYALGAGEVHIQPPYMSADALEWVFSYTSPIVLDDGTKPAFYHFEIPVTHIQDIVRKDSAGRTFLVTNDGLVLADSAKDIGTKLKAGVSIEADHFLKDYLPGLGSISESAGFAAIMNDMKGKKDGHATYKDGGETYYVVHRHLPTFGWSIAEVKSYSALMEGSASLVQIKRTVFIAGVISLVIAVVAVLIAAGRITRPIHDIALVAEKIASGDLTTNLPQKISGDETGQLSIVMRDMSEKLTGVVLDVKHAAGDVASASHQMRAHAEQISSSVRDQTERSGQIVASATAMTQTCIEIAKNTAQVSSVAETTSRSAEEGETAINESVDDVKTIATTVEEFSGIVSSLGERSAQIGEIVGVINDIADQTNLLALNAAIEAARAGEQGRGFAVVADEVRGLAERTAKATLEINEMILAIQQEVARAVKSMEDGTKMVDKGVERSIRGKEIFHAIVDDVRALQGMVREIATATEELTHASEQIGMDISVIAEGTSGTQSGIENISVEAHGLEELSEKLEAVISYFTLTEDASGRRAMSGGEPGALGGADAPRAALFPPGGEDNGGEGFDRHNLKSAN